MSPCLITLCIPDETNAAFFVGACLQAIQRVVRFRTSQIACQQAPTAIQRVVRFRTSQIACKQAPTARQISLILNANWNYSSCHAATIVETTEKIRPVVLDPEKLQTFPLHVFSLSP